MKINASGLRTATKRLSDGRVAYYAYAYQGGPLIAKGTGRDLDAARDELEKALARPEAGAKLAAAREAAGLKARPSVAYVEGVVQAFLQSAEFQKLAASTQRDYRRILDQFRAEFGDWQTRLFEDARIAQDMALWRDEAAGARAGDMRISVVSRLFGWARSRGFTSARPTEPLERVYSASRAEAIWDEESLSRLLQACHAPLRWAVLLAVNTGLRQGDLIRLPWSAVSDVAIRWKTSKRRRDAFIPLTPDLQTLLKEIPQRADTILTNSAGQPWTGDGLRTSFGKAKAKAGITGLRWHDFRGTAVTRLASTNLRTRDIALIIGWSEAKVESIMARYVSTEALAKDMLARLQQSPELAPLPLFENENMQTACKPGAEQEDGKPPNL